MHERHWGPAGTDLFYRYLKVCFALAISLGRIDAKSEDRENWITMMLN